MEEHHHSFDQWPHPPPYFRDVSSLEPPAIPDATENLHCFGIPLYETYTEQFNALEKELTIVYDKNDLDIRKELKKLNKSLMFNFLQLIDTFAKSPEGAEEFVEKRIRPLFLNMHHLLNIYRPHQARQLLISSLEAQVEKRNNLVKSLEKRFDRILSTLKEAHNHALASPSPPQTPTINNNDDVNSDDITSNDVVMRN